MVRLRILVAAEYKPGDIFLVQFVWKLPEGDYIRAIFEAEVITLDERLDRYLVRLDRWIAGRQESAKGETRPVEDADREYWSLVAQKSGSHILLAYEVVDGRPIHLRMETLTGEHTYFSKLNDLMSENSA